MARRVLPLVAVLLVAVGCSRRPDPEPPVVLNPGPVNIPEPDDGSIPPPRLVVRKYPDESFTKGVAWLLKQQSPDGAWRSDVYATFKDGTALTPLALCALLDAANAGLNTPESVAARKKAAEWLAKFVKADGTIDPGPDGFDYPIYTATLIVKALSHPENAARRKDRDAWVKYILDRQLTEKLGWKAEEKQYGGWGYCRVIPKKPEPNMIAPSLIESNLSATVFALDALKAAGVTDAEVYKKAAVFVRHCQSWMPPDAVPYPVPIPNDGGFHFIYDDPVRNKAGPVSSRFGAPLPVFHSYGSTSADGFRALTLCDLPEDKERRDAARGWLLKNFRADTHPGKYVEAHEANRKAVYYYYAASVSRAFRDSKLTLPDGRDWALELAHELSKRQREDGSWANPVELVRENEPIVATCNAVSTLARCKK